MRTLRPARALVSALIIALAALGGCQAGESTPTFTASVSGDFGKAPNLTFASGMTITDTTSTTVVTGTGSQYTQGATVLIDVHAVNVNTGAVVLDTYRESPRTYTLDPAVIGKEMFDALVGARVGSRVMLWAASDQVVSVFDLYATFALGQAIALDPSFGFTVTGDRQPQVKITGALPSAFTAAPIIRGPGAQVTPGQQLTVQFVAVDGATGQVVESTWPADLPFRSRLNTSVPPAWTEALEGQTVGSRVVAVAPPDKAYRDGRTIIFVIDILHARDVND